MTDAEEKEQPPFEEALADLFERETVPVHHIFRLTDMSDAEWALFLQGFNSAEDQRRAEIVRHMADIAEDNFVVDFAPVFTLGLNDSYGPVRQASLDGLWDSTSLSVMATIADLLANDPVDEVRVAAAQALSHYVLMAEWGEVSAEASVPVVDVLILVHRDHEASLALRRAALEALGGSSHERVPRLINAAYESATPEMRLSALFAMGTSADDRWLEIVLDEMENPREDMRAEAARAAGNIGSSEAVELLSELVYDPSEDVAVTAVGALGQIGGGEALALLDELSADAEYEHLHEAITLALEEMSWLGDDLDIMSMLGGEGDLPSNGSLNGEWDA